MRYQLADNKCEKKFVTHKSSEFQHFSLYIALLWQIIEILSCDIVRHPMSILHVKASATFQINASIRKEKFIFS